ncbi:suppressor of mec-8 and unc-52-like protein 2 [Chlorella sorokiniana]|uniref:Suppressor of mec-8 and unc-52-like protein 2 n=1 Tax=Chlorella sorokiniana TaxID=3076 RepID=A0A2P6U3Y5_CHLSO|nr:suppressor of mec-8 and unc-52-like protein 2 [Chlorella sorokiniana]|eukprot:PRW61028.1 suppressor of mec-8 and unc-52-like protein 2 [Chlorella sorokiniana]
MAAGGLRNEDFRKLLATPRPGAGGGAGSGGGAEGEKQKKAKKPGRNYRPGGKPGAKEGEEDEGPKYRDRAAERRKGMSTEFEGVPDDLVGLLEGKGDLRNVSYEDSKYLGGDVAHTHLVKGLDFALLHKVRAEQEAAKRSGGAGGESDEEEAPQLAKPVPLPSAPAVQPSTFTTPLGRAVFNFFFDPKQRGGGVPVHELFLPKRTAFVYELEDPDAPDVPTTLRRSKEDCPKVKEMATGGLDHSVLERIAKIMSYMTVAGGGRKKLKRREREALLQQHGIALAGQLKSQAAEGPASRGAAGTNGSSAPASQEGNAAGAAAAAEGGPPPPPPEDDDDIFGDVGTDYEPTIKDKERMQQKAAAAAEAGRRGGYFGGGEDLHADLPPLPKDDDRVPPPPPPPEEGEIMGPDAGPARPPAGYDAAAAYGAYPEPDAAAAEEAVAEAVRQEKAKEKRRAAELLASAGGDDAYAECYPSYYDYGTMMEDSDEEGGAPLQQQALTRRDFASEADWQEYQATGMAPRQLEGRAKVRQQQKDASKEKSKIATQLGKIQKIMEEKGYDHTAAFTKPRRERGEGGEGGGGGGGEGAAPAGGFTKKRRI